MHSREAKLLLSSASAVRGPSVGPIVKGFLTLVHVQVHKKHLPNARIPLRCARRTCLVVEDAPA